MKRNFTFLIAALALLVFMMPTMAGWGQTRTATPDGTFIIDFYDEDKLTSTSGTGLQNNNYAGFVSVPAGVSATEVVTSVSVTGTVRFGMNGGLTAGTGTAAGADSHYVTFNISSDYKVTKCTVYATKYEDGRWMLNGNVAASGSLGAKGATIDQVTDPLIWNSSNGMTALTFKKDNGSGGNQKRLTIYRIVCEYGTGGGTPSPTYTVTYDAGEHGSGTMTDSNEYEEGDEVTLLPNSFEAEEGYEWSSWLVEDADNNEITVTNGKFVMPDSDVTVTAQWDAVGPNVTYDFSDATKFFTDAALTTNVPTGNTTSVGTFYYENGDMFTANGDNRYFGAGSNKYFLIGKAGATLALPTYEGYKITQLIIHNSTGCSTKVNVAIVSGSNTAATGQTWGNQGVNYTYNIASEYQTSALSVKITNDYNAQITGITVVREEINSNKVATPTFEPAGGVITESTDVTINCDTDDATIYYTTDGSTPTTSSAVYSQAITVNSTMTLKAIAVKSGMTDSNVGEAAFTRKYFVNLTQATGGTISVNPAQAEFGQTVTLTAAANVGYAFDSWIVTPSVTLDGNTFAMPANDVTVTATFTASTDARTVSFSINNKVEMTATVFDGGSIDLTKFVAEGDGYTFEGWSTTDGGEIITPQNAYTPTGNITLYPGVAPEPTGDEYTLVTNVSQLEAGNLVVITANGEKNIAMSTTQADNNRRATSKDAPYHITKTSDYSTISINNDDVCELVLGGTTGAWTFKDTGWGDNGGYLFATNNSSNYLRTQATNDANGVWTISINNGEATITTTRDTNIKSLRYNSGSNIFSCYASSQQTVFLYTKSASKSVKDNRAVPTTSKVTAIDANVLVTVKSNGIVYLTGSNNGNEANLIVEDGGQLVTSANVKGTMQKAITGYTSSSNGWYFISSSLNNRVNISDVQNLINSGNNYDLYYFKQDPSDGLEWINQKNTSGFTQLYVGSGYLYANAANTTLGFAGTLGKNDNSDQKPVDLTYEAGDNVDPDMQGWNLVGNPFPSYAKVDRAFFRMKNTNDGINTEAVPANSVINPTEGVFVHASQTEENVTFTATTTTGSKNRLINIDVARQGEMLDNAIVSLNAEGSLCKLVLNENTTRVYFHQDEKDYAILASSNENEVPVSFKASRNGNYTITVKPEDVEMNYLHLIDNMTGADVDLLANSSYTFEAKKTDYKSRFRLVFSANSIDEASTSSATFAYYNGTSWTVTNEGESTLQVVDVTGRIVSSEAINGCANVNINAANGVYMLRLVNGNNVKTQKIVVK